MPFVKEAEEVDDSENPALRYKKGASTAASPAHLVFVRFGASGAYHPLGQCLIPACGYHLQTARSCFRRQQTRTQPHAPGGSSGGAGSGHV